VSRKLHIVIGGHCHEISDPEITEHLVG